MRAVAVVGRYWEVVVIFHTLGYSATEVAVGICDPPAQNQSHG
jgi:hypothetical protein